MDIFALLLPLIAIVTSIVIGAWTGWHRHLTYRQFLSTFPLLIVVGLILFQVAPRVEINNPAVGLGLLLLIPIWYFGMVHVVVRRLHTVGWQRWLAFVPVLNNLVGIILLFKRDPRNQGRIN